MRLLVFGSTGQLAQELQAICRATDLDCVFLSREEANLESVATIEAAVTDNNACDVVINAAAYTSVDKAEAEAEKADLINNVAVGAMAAACREVDVPLIHVSTDYVFDGSKEEPYLETDPANPKSVYGKTKFSGECAVADAMDRYIILRTSWLYSVFGNNFVKTMLRLGADHKELSVIDDQWGAPTSVRSLAETILRICNRIADNDDATGWGTYHFTARGRTNWFDFANEIFSYARKKGYSNCPRLTPVSALEYGSDAPRPANSTMNCSKIEQQFGVQRHNWNTEVHRTLDKLMAMSR